MGIRPASPGADSWKPHLESPPPWGKSSSAVLGCRGSISTTSTGSLPHPPKLGRPSGGMLAHSEARHVPTKFCTEQKNTGSRLPVSS